MSRDGLSVPAWMPLRWIVGGLLLMALASCASPRPEFALNKQDWQQYKQQFIAESGRVIDTGQGNISHSEGQGYGMLLAVAFQDQKTFDRIWQWSRKHLQIREADRLLAWRWEPGAKAVTDANNATDGDIMVVWALQRAFHLWKNRVYRSDAVELSRALQALLVKDRDKRFLLPGAQGFSREGGYILNPSYLMFPAFQQLQRWDTSLNWKSLYSSGQWLLKSARFGRWGLAPDWIEITPDSLAPDPNRNPYFSYDAIRVPLYLAWAGERELLKTYDGFWAEFSMDRDVIASVDLETDRVRMTDDFQATRALKELARYVVSGGREGQFPVLNWNRGPKYYDASLVLLSQLAWIEQQ